MHIFITRWLFEKASVQNTKLSSLDSLEHLADYLNANPVSETSTSTHHRPQGSSKDE